MAIIATEGPGKSGNFTPHPAGVQPAVMVDVQDLGMVENKRWDKVEPKIAVYFYAGKTKELEDGRKFPLLVRETYTLYLSEKARLRAMLESWLGRSLTPQELKKGFDVESMIGQPALIQVVHNVDGEKTYANLKSVLPLMEGMTAPAIPEGYVRIKDREPKQEEAKQQYGEPVGGGAPFQTDDDDLPFSY